MTKTHLKLVVNNGKLIDEADILAKEQWQLILRKYDVQKSLTELTRENEELGVKILNYDKQISKLEGEVNGTTKRKASRDNNINST